MHLYEGVIILVVFLLIVIIIILAPGLVGIAALGTIGVGAYFAPLILISIVGGLVLYFVEKNCTESREDIIYHQAQQAITDKYAAFTIVCFQLAGGNDICCNRQQLINFDSNCYAEGTSSIYRTRTNLQDLCDALGIKHEDAKYSYEKGKQHCQNDIKWYEGNFINKLCSVNNTTPKDEYSSLLKYDPALCEKIKGLLNLNENGYKKEH